LFEVPKKNFVYNRAKSLTAIPVTQQTDQSTEGNSINQGTLAATLRWFTAGGAIRITLRQLSETWKLRH